jgi:hypothetical protein
MPYELNRINFCKIKVKKFSIAAAMMKLFNDEIVKTKQFNTAL